MNFELDDRQSETQRIAAEAARDLVAPGAAARDRHHTFPADTLRALGRQGLLAINIDPAHGGRGAGVVAYVLAVRELAGACAATTVGLMVTNMVAEAIQRFGDADQHTRFLPPIARGEWAAAGFSLSEPDSGSDAASLRTTAVRDGDHYVLDGTKSWVTSGGEAGVYLVMARTDPEQRSRGISAFLVDADTPGLTAAKPEDKLGQRGSPTTQLILDGCRVPAAHRLGPEGIGFKIAMASLDGGRVGVSAQAVGVATAAAAAATRYVAERFDDMPPEMADMQRQIADCATEIDAGWLLCLRAAALKDQGRPMTREAAMSKLYCTEMANRVCRRALEVLGADGITRATPVERYLRDARVTRIYEGTSEVQRIVIARETLRLFA